MTATSQHNIKVRLLRLVMFSLVLGGFFVPGERLEAAIAVAGTVIQNQAAASYEPCLDSACVGTSPAETVTSNIVETLVQQVAGIALTNDQLRPASSGGIALLPHELVNTGNGPDQYEICLENVDANIGSWAVYLDEDGDGQPDSTTALFDDSDPDDCADTLTPNLPAGGSYSFVIEVGIPVGLADGTLPTLDVTGNSDFDNAVSDTNTDTIEVVSGPVIEVSKRLSENMGASPSGSYTVTLEYRNTGLAAAHNLIIEDDLPLLTAEGAAGGMTYVAGSGRWSITGATVLTDVESDLQGPNPPQILWCAYDLAATVEPDCQDRVRAEIDVVTSGEVASLTFEVNIAADIEDGERILNDVDFNYQNVAEDTTYGSPVPFQSNTVAFQVNSAAVNPLVVMNNSLTDASTGVIDSSDTGNLVEIASISQGDRIQFTNVIWNTGDGEDTFDILVDDVLDREGVALANAFPTGTLYRLLRSDGVTPLSDTDASGTPDTGPIPLPETGGCSGRFVYDASESACGFVVVLEVVLPASTVSADVPGAGFEVTKIARSGIDPTVVNKVTDRLLAIVDAAVDITNDVSSNPGPAPGEGPYSPTPVTIINAAPEAIAVFTLVVTNEGNAADNFDIEASDDLDFTNAVFASNPGWSLDLVADGGVGDCSTFGSPMSQTGVLAPGAFSTVCARVTVPAAAAANSTLDVNFRANSPNTNANDTKLDRVVVTVNPEIDLIKNENGQLSPGGSVEYSHVVTNTGNIDLDTVIFTAGPAPDVDEGWSIVLYLDLNDDGVLDGSDPYIEPGVAVTAAPLVLFSIGESVRLFARVFSPTSASFGEDNVKTLSVSAVPVGGGAPVMAAVSDTTTATFGDMEVLKEQALDADCDGIADGPSACAGEACFQITTFQVVPGTQCVVYRLTATNSGSSALYNVVINDTTQPFTTYLGDPDAESCERPAGNCDGQITAPADMGSGDVSAAIGTLQAGESARLYFGLRVD